MGVGEVLDQLLAPLHQYPEQGGVLDIQAGSLDLLLVVDVDLLGDLGSYLVIHLVSIVLHAEILA